MGSPWPRRYNSPGEESATTKSRTAFPTSNSEAEPSGAQKHSDCDSSWSSNGKPATQDPTHYILYNYLTSGSKVEAYDHNANQSQVIRSTTQSSSSQKENSVSVREIPSWAIYYGDQRDRLVKFSVQGNSYFSDSYLNKRVSLCFDDICISELAVDAVVNPTTDNYASVAGVAKRIHDEAGSSLQDVCRTLPKLEVGEVVITQGFNLPAKYVIHTNGPHIRGDDWKLTHCYEKSLNLLLLYGLRTIVFPCISTGQKRMNREVAANIALKTVRQFLEYNKDRVDRIIFSLHNSHDIVIYRRFMQVYFPIDGG